jgi:molybdenum cofactor biosynthesis enzyme MoaA
MIRFEQIAIGTGGGPRCRRCSAAGADQSFRDAQAITADIAAVVSAWDASPGPNVLFAGAEPFAHDALPRLIAQARATGVKRIGLVTDGGALGFGDNAVGTVHAGVRHVVVRSIGLGEAADQRARHAGLSEAVVSGTRAFLDAAKHAEATVAISAEVAVCRHNADDLPGIVAAFGKAGVGCVTFFQDAGAAPAPASVATMLAAACDTGVVNGVWVEVRDLRLPATHALHRVAECSAP